MGTPDPVDPFATPVVDAFETQMVEAGAWSTVIYQFEPTKPNDGYTPDEHCAKFGHSFQVIRSTTDQYGEEKTYSKCRVCGKEYSYLESE